MHKTPQSPDRQLILAPHTPNEAHGLKAKLVAVYRDWVNNYITLNKFAADYELSVEQADQLIKIGQSVHESMVMAALKLFCFYVNGKRHEVAATSLSFYEVANLAGLNPLDDLLITYVIEGKAYIMLSNQEILLFAGAEFTANRCTK